jgi:hypothetical protein
MIQMTMPKEAVITIDFLAGKYSRMVQLFQPLVYRDGNAYCSVLGPNPQEGITGCGASPGEALADWEDHLRKRMKQIKDKPENEADAYVLDKLSGSTEVLW